MFVFVHDHCLPFTSTIIKEKINAKRLYDQAAEMQVGDICP